MLAGAFLQPTPVFFRLCGRLSGLAVPVPPVPADDENRQQHHQDCGRNAEQRQPGVHKALQYRVPVNVFGQLQQLHWLFLLCRMAGKRGLLRAPFPGGRFLRGGYASGGDFSGAVFFRRFFPRVRFSGGDSPEPPPGAYFASRAPLTIW